MQKKKGSLLSFRPDIKVVDATIRDGGLVNNFHFTEDFIKDLYAANVAAGVDSLCRTLDVVTIKGILSHAAKVLLI